MAATCFANLAMFIITEEVARYKKYNILKNSMKVQTKKSNTFYKHFLKFDYK